MTEADLLRLLPAIQAGKIIVMKRGPWPCLCGAMIDTCRFLSPEESAAMAGVATEMTCPKCGEKVYS